MNIFLHLMERIGILIEKSDDNEVINSMKDELKNMFYKNRNHVIKNVMTTQERLKKIKYEPEIIIVQDGAKKPTKKAIKNVENEIVIVQDGAKKPTKKATNINKK
jgi:cellulose synthase/poly-beta-1,6-N-acetylglucosamine synthase-like glycosyltransferase